MSIEPTCPIESAAGQTWDAAVVGAGVGGALAARQLAREGLRVLLVDRAAFPRTKVCGCCLNGRAVALLRRAGLGAVVEPGRAAPLDRLELAAGRGRARLGLHGWMAQSRAALDSALVRGAIAQGCEFLPRTSAKLGPLDDDGRTLVLEHEGRNVTVAARVVIAADGLGGRLIAEANGNGAIIGKDSRIGAGSVIAAEGADIPPGMIRMACGHAGYVGMVRLEDGRINVAAALDRAAVREAGGMSGTVAAILEQARLPSIAGLKDWNWRGTPTLTRRPCCVAAPRLLALGDAAGYVEPFTGEGMAWAMSAAVAVTPLVARAVAEPAYPISALERDWIRYHRGIVRRRQFLCSALAKLLRRPVLMRGAVALLERVPCMASAVVRSLESENLAGQIAPGRPVTSP